MKYILSLLILSTIVHSLYAQKDDIEKNQLDSLTWQELDSIGNAFSAKSNYTEAVIYLQKGIEITQKKFGNQDTVYATLANDLAVVYRKQGLYQKAELLFLEAKNIQESKIGKLHSSYADVSNNLAILYHSLRIL